MNETSPARPLLIFDGDCSFCRACVQYGKNLTGERVQYAPFQEVADQFPRIPRKDFASAVKLVMPDGEVRSGAHAAFSVIAFSPGKSWMLGLYDHAPGVEAIAEAGYRVVARNRSFFYWVTRLLWGIPPQPESFQLSSWLFLRLLGAIYLVAFVSFGTQAAGLIGAKGILPVAEFLPAVRQYLGVAAYWNLPTVLWFNSGNAFIKADWIAGVCLAVALLFGLNWRGIRIALFILYLSLVTASQVFLSYQWDALLLEAGFLAIFLGSSGMVVWLFRWLLLRLMFLSGAVKLLSGDPSWHSFTALPVHYQTQPLPTPLAWYFYQLPTWFQRLSIGTVFFVELIVPFLIFAPRRVRLFAVSCLVVFQVLIFLTGNYAFFNLLTIAFCVFLLDDRIVQRVLPAKVVEKICNRVHQPRYPVLRNAILRTVVALVLFVSGFQLIETFAHTRWGPADLVIRAVSPFEIVNTYGLFAVMTTSRPEIVIEGSSDGKTWVPYEFRYKVGDTSRKPAWVAPFQPRLDWQMWFAALSGDYRNDPWIVQMMARLLEGSPDVLRLLGKNPFPAAPPRFIRAVIYDYRFTTPAEKQAGGGWWQRELKGSYLPELSLENR